MRMAKKVAVVIGAGGIKCAAALGMWKAFQREGIAPDWVVGCSGGAIYAAGMALGYTEAEIEQGTLALYKHDLIEGYTSNLRAAMAGEIPFNERTGMVDDAPTMQAFRSFVGERTFESAAKPLFIVATALATGEPVVLSQGDVVNAIRASISIPMVYAPFEIDGRLLIDGAVSDPLPIDVAIREGADIIIAMGFEVSMRSRFRSYLAMTQHLNTLYMNNILRSSFAFYNLAHHAEVVTMLPEFDRAINAFDAHLSPYIIEQGEKAAEAQLPYLKRLLHANE
jgi:NTE family protein